MSTGFVKALGKIGHVLPTYTLCLDANLSFSSTSGGTNTLSAGLITGLGIISSYIIEWHLNSTSGATVLVSGYNPDDTVDVLHPFTDQTVQGGDLYPVIRYITIENATGGLQQSGPIRYSPFYRVGQYSPDLKLCLNYVTVNVPPEVECLDGLVVETVYLHTSTDVSLLPFGYSNPCGVGGHTCSRAFFEIYGNGIYIGDSKLNNTNTPLSGCISAYGTYVFADYHNYPDQLTYPNTWLSSGGSQYARYNKTVLNRQQAIDIAAAGSGTTISFSLLPGMITYGCGTSVHNSVTWTRITNSYGQVLWNSCITGNNVTLIDVCNTGSTSGQTTTTTTTLPPTTTTTTTCIGPGCYNIFDSYGGGKIINISGNTALIVILQSNWNEGLLGFSNWNSAMTSVDSLTYSGYSDWRLPTVSEWKIIGFVPGAATQLGWNQFSYYWTSDEIDVNNSYRWRTSDDSCSMYGEAYNIESSVLKSTAGLYGIAVRTENL